MHNRTPEHGFSTEWFHTSSLLVAKTIKDMVIREEQDFWHDTLIEQVFFRDQSVWNQLNKIAIQMQLYVLHHPTYKSVNSQKDYVNAVNGDKQAQDFCMVNFNICFVELKAFYLLKMLDGEAKYSQEDLANFNDFTYLPLL